MQVQVKIKSAPELQEKYKKLMRQEWTRETLRSVLKLLRQEIEHSGSVRLSFPWEEPAKTTAKAFPVQYPVPKNASKTLRSFLENVNSSLCTPLPEKVPSPGKDARTEISEEAFQTWFFLVGLRLDSANIQLNDDAGLFGDSLSVLFQCAVFFLLPELHSAGLRREHDTLIHALVAHTKLYWDSNPSHQFFLRSIVSDYVGDKSGTHELLAAALNTTGFEEHDYATKVQSLWANLIENGQFDKAESFLLQIYRDVPPALLSAIDPELRAMLRDTYFGNTPALSGAS